MMAVPICETSVVLDEIGREMCIGAKCIRYEIDEQFKVAYELVMAIAKFCDVKIMNEKSKAYREGL
jgi:hypothetical protein